MLMKNDIRTEIIFLLDKSISMAKIRRECISGYCRFLQKQKEASPNAVITAVFFNEKVQTVHDRIPIRDAAPITEKDYDPKGSTAMLDAIGSTVEHIIEEQAKEKNPPKITLLAIMTDGLDNSSTKYTYPQVRKLIKEREKAGWQCIFIADNDEAFIDALRIGIPLSCTVKISRSIFNFRTLLRAITELIYRR